MRRRKGMPGVSHPSWADVARQYRRALDVLGWPLPRCLPDEAGACGASAADHAAAYLGTLQAVVESRIAHLHGGEDVVAGSYAETLAELAELETIRPCGREH